MTWLLVHQDDRALLATDKPVLKAADRPALDDAVALLARVRADAQRADFAREAAEADARERGRAEGVAQGRRAFADSILRLTEQTAAHRIREEEEVAMLALAALRQIAGDVGDATIMQGVALRAARAVVPQGPVTVEVAPAIAAEVEAGLARLDHGAEVTVRADPSLGERQCRVTGPDSRIIADLDRQIDELAERWGVTDGA